MNGPNARREYAHSSTVPRRTEGRHRHLFRARRLCLYRSVCNGQVAREPSGPRLISEWLYAHLTSTGGSIAEQELGGLQVNESHASDRSGSRTPQGLSLRHSMRQRFRTRGKELIREDAF